MYTTTVFINPLDISPNSVRPFITDVYVNQSSLPMEFITNEYSVTITVPVIFRRYANTKFNKEKTSLLTITENNNLIVKAFATAWRYREMYEECGDVDTVARKVGSTPRTIYRFLDIAYMYPTKVNEILSGKTQVNVNDLFKPEYTPIDFLQ